MREMFLVWRMHGNGPTKIHTSLQSAVDEARRLARVSPSDVFVVLKAIDAFRVSKPEPPVESVPITELDEIPF